MSKPKKSKPIRKNIFNDNPEKKITQSKEEIASPEYEKKIEEIYNYLKDGMRPAEIYAMFTLDDPEMNESRFVKMLQDTYAYSETAIQKDRDYVFQLHMNRYEDIYEKAMQMLDGYGKPLNEKDWSQWRMIVTKYTQALSALNAKEDLLGLHDKKIVLEFNEQSATVVEKEEAKGDSIPGYNIENLSLEEQIELLSLIKDSRTVPIEGIQRVVVKTTTLEINPETGQRKKVKEINNVQDVEFEEMPPNVISKMTNIEVVQEEEEVIVDPIKDEIDRKNLPAPKTAIEIKDAMQEKLLKQFKERLKKKK